MINEKNNLLYPEPFIILALDNASTYELDRLIEQFTPQDCRLKIGKELFTREGPAYVKQLIDKGFAVFLDLKFHDIPNTVANACRAAADMGVWMVNVHASGGLTMMHAAREALELLTEKKPLLIAVTVLTSMNQLDLQQIGIHENLTEHVQHLASLTQQAGLDGVVCSAQEAQHLRKQFGEQFCLVTPGIQLEQKLANDQKRTLTPTEAMQAGANYLVIGRAITQSAEPMQQLQMINKQLFSNLNIHLKN